MSLFAIVARSSTYADEFIVILDVPSVFIVILDVPSVPYFPLCNHCRSGSRNIMNKYGLRVSPWIVPLCIGIFCV